jgi:hypothetical protein
MHLRVPFQTQLAFSSSTFYVFPFLCYLFSITFVIFSYIASSFYLWLLFWPKTLSSICLSFPFPPINVPVHWFSVYINGIKEIFQ